MLIGMALAIQCNIIFGPVSRVQASVQADLDAIRAIVESYSGGYETLDGMVKKHLRRWFQSQGGVKVADLLNTKNYVAADGKSKYRGPGGYRKGSPRGSPRSTPPPSPKGVRRRTKAAADARSEFIENKFFRQCEDLQCGVCELPFGHGCGCGTEV